MTTFTLTVPTEVAHVTVPLPTTPGWTTKWLPGELADAWYAVRKVGECIELEVEFSRASFIPGRKARPWVPDIAITQTAPAGWVLQANLNQPWPSTIPIKRGACRRYALYPAHRPDLRAAAVLIAAGQFKTPAPNFKSWGPAKLPLGSLSFAMAAQVAKVWAQRYVQLRNTLLTKTDHWAATANGDVFTGWYAEDAQDAPWSLEGGVSVWGPPDPGAPAGSGVLWSTGWQQCVEWLRYALLSCQCLHERANLAYNRLTGQPITVDDYHGQYSPDYSPGSGDVNNQDLPEFTGVTNHDARPPMYDASHRLRFDRYIIAVAEMCDSPMIKRMIANAAAQVRLQWTERGRLGDASYYPMNLSIANAQVHAHPHQGLPGTNAGRTLGEPAFIFAANRGFNGTTPGAEAWVNMYLDTIVTGCPPSGVMQRNNQPGQGAWDGGKHDLAHAFEVPMLDMGTVAVCRQFNRPIPEQVTLSLKSIYCNRALLRAYYNNQVGPWDYLWVADTEGDPYSVLPGGQTTPGSPEGDATHATLGCALGYSIVGDPEFLTAMCAVGTPAPSTEAKLAQFQAADNLDWDAFAMGTLQGLH